MNSTDGSTKVETKEKFRETLTRLAALEGAVTRLESLTTKLCGQTPTPESADKVAEVDVDCLARLLSDTPQRISRIEVEINTCTDRLRSELD